MLQTSQATCLKKSHASHNISVSDRLYIWQWAQKIMLPNDVIAVLVCTLHDSHTMKSPKTTLLRVYPLIKKCKTVFFLHEYEFSPLSYILNYRRKSWIYTLKIGQIKIAQDYRQSQSKYVSRDKWTKKRNLHIKISTIWYLRDAH